MQRRSTTSRGRRGCGAPPAPFDTLRTGRRERRRTAVRRRADLHARPVAGSLRLVSVVSLGEGTKWPALVGDGQRRSDPRAGGSLRRAQDEAEQSRPQALLVDRPSIRRGDGGALRFTQDGAEQAEGRT